MVSDKWGGRFAGLGGVAVTAGFGGYAKKQGWGFMTLTSKNFDTRWLLGAAFLGGGYWTSGMLSRGLEGGAYGFLAPALSDFIRK